MLKLFKLSEKTYLKDLLDDTLTDSRLKEYIEKNIDINQLDDIGNHVIFKLIKQKKNNSIKIFLKNNIVSIYLENSSGINLLEEAIEKQNSEIVNYLLNNGYDINYLNSFGRTIIHDLCLFENEKYINFLSNYSPNFNIKDKNGKTPIFLSAEGNNLNIFKTIIDKTKNLNDLDLYKRNILYYAIKKHKKEYVYEILNRNIDINNIDINEENVLFQAIEIGDENFDIIEMLIKLGINLNKKNKEEKSILEELFILEKHNLSKSFTKIKELIIEKGNFDLNEVNKNDKTILEIEIEHKHYENVELLINYGADLNRIDSNKESILYKELLKGNSNYRMIDLLVEKGVKLNERDYEEKSVIDNLLEMVGVSKGFIKDKRMYTLKINKDEKYEALLKKFILLKPIIEKRKNGQDTIFDLLLYNDFESLKWILQTGIDINMKDNNGKTSFIYMIEEGLLLKDRKERDLFLERVVNILKYRVNIDDQDNEGRTVLHKAVIANDTELVEKLLSKKSDLNKKDIHGRTALQHTQWTGNYRIARWLISAGANINIVDNSGFTLLNYAAILGHEKLLIILIRAGVLMYNYNQKNKKALEFFRQKEKDLEKLKERCLNVADEKLKTGLMEVIENLKKEIKE